MEPHAKRRKQLVGIDRLGQVVRRSRFQAFLAVTLHGFRRQRDDRKRERRRPFELAALVDPALAIHGLSDAGSSFLLTMALLALYGLSTALLATSLLWL